MTTPDIFLILEKKNKKKSTITKLLAIDENRFMMCEKIVGIVFDGILDVRFEIFGLSNPLTRFYDFFRVEWGQGNFIFAHPVYAFTLIILFRLII